MERKPEPIKLTGLMTIRCWNCGKLLERHPCSKEADGATLHELCPKCKDTLEHGMEKRK